MVEKILYKNTIAYCYWKFNNKLTILKRVFSLYIKSCPTHLSQSLNSLLIKVTLCDVMFFRVLCYQSQQGVVKCPFKINKKVIFSIILYTRLQKSRLSIAVFLSSKTVSKIEHRKFIFVCKNKKRKGLCVNNSQ